jgi:uncharacterized membrane protein
VDAATQAVLDRDIAVIAYNITGSIRSCQVAFSRLKQNEPMIDHSSIFWKFGTRKWARISKVWRARQDSNLGHLAPKASALSRLDYAPQPSSIPVSS